MSPDARAVLEAVARAKLAAAVENEKRATELEKEAGDLRKSAAAGRAVANELAVLRAPASAGQALVPVPTPAIAAAGDKDKGAKRRSAP